MAVEDHPMFLDWKAAVERLIDTVKAFSEGSASQQDIDRAKRDYNRIADEV